MNKQAPEPVDRSKETVRANLARIKLIAVAGTVFLNPDERNRLIGLLCHRLAWGQEPPWVMAAVHRDIEENKAQSISTFVPFTRTRFRIVRQADHNETVGHALERYGKEIDAGADAFQAKRHCLFLSRRGGRGRPRFISPFTEGQGTTCGEWTKVVERKPDGKLLKGFMKASLAVGFCPVECPYCYLQMPYTEGMDIALNWEDLADELRTEYRGYPYPSNFGETSGLVEYDEWFFNGLRNSMVQFVIDACAAADGTPFFLTKIRYPRYLVFKGKVQAGISLMPEPVRQWLAPHGSPSDELLASLAWAVARGAIDPVIRMTVVWRERDLYPDLLAQCRKLLGPSGWRLTLDVLRFTPGTARTIFERYPTETTDRMAYEIRPDGHTNLLQLARARRGEKKIRPPAERQAEIFTWFRNELNRLGCSGVLLTPGKGAPEELLPLVRSKTIGAMPCACYGVTRAEKKPGVVALPVVGADEAGQEG